MSMVDLSVPNKRFLVPKYPEEMHCVGKVCHTNNFSFEVKLSSEYLNWHLVFLLKTLCIIFHLSLTF